MRPFRARRFSASPPAELSDARVREVALNRLTRSELSEKALFQYLQRKGAKEEQAAREVARLVELGMVSDQRLARALIRVQLLRGKSGHVIRQALRLKGISVTDARWKELYSEILRESSDGMANQALGWTEEPNLDQSHQSTKAAERERAEQVLTRKYSRFSEDPKVARRAFGALIRRGFSVDIVKDLIPNRLLREPR